MPDAFGERVRILAFIRSFIEPSSTYVKFTGKKYKINHLNNLNHLVAHVLKKKTVKNTKQSSHMAL